MATTIPGGKYLSADGKTYHDAEGNVLSAQEPVEPAPLVETAPLPVAEQVSAPVPAPAPPAAPPALPSQGPKAVIAKKG